jgi:hypothetical protein
MDNTDAIVSDSFTIIFFEMTMEMPVTTQCVSSGMDEVDNLEICRVSVNRYID